MFVPNKITDVVTNCFFNTEMESEKMLYDNLIITTIVVIVMIKSRQLSSMLIKTIDAGCWHLSIKHDCNH